MAASRNPNPNPNQSTTFWQNHVESWKNSGLSQAAYCREHGLNEVSLSYYKRKFNDELLLPAKTQSTTSGFVGVQLAPATPQVESLTLHFANGAHLSGICGDNVDVVAKLARALA